MLDALLPARPQDDVALLIAKTRVLGPNQVADREVPFDPASVADARAWSTAKLDEWGLADLAFGTELVLSELVTNAIRYGLPPVRVRLLRDRSLICEVADGSNTSPHLKYAATTDEGGAGLFLVSQLTDHWGTRYSPRARSSGRSSRSPARPEVWAGRRRRPRRRSRSRLPRLRTTWTWPDSRRHPASGRAGRLAVAVSVAPAETGLPLASPGPAGAPLCRTPAEGRPRAAGAPAAAPSAVLETASWSAKPMGGWVVGDAEGSWPPRSAGRAGSGNVEYRGTVRWYAGAVRVL